MDQNAFNALNLGLNENEIPLNPITSTESSYSPVTQQDLNIGTYYYEHDLCQQYQQAQTYSMNCIQQNTLSLNATSMTQSWPSSPSTMAQPRPFLETSYSTLVTATSDTSVSQPFHLPNQYQTQGLIPIAKRPSISQSIRSFHSSDPDQDDAPSESQSPLAKDEANERRRSRRRAQNRAAQRAFRARKEETIKEGSIRLEALQDELKRLQNQNGNLSNTVSELRGQIMYLQQENGVLRRKSQSEGLDWSEYTTFGGQSMETATRQATSDSKTSALTSPSDDRLAGFNVGMMGTVAWGETSTSTSARVAGPNLLPDEGEGGASGAAQTDKGGGLEPGKMGESAAEVGGATYDAAANLLR